MILSEPLKTKRNGNLQLKRRIFFVITVYQVAKKKKKVIAMEEKAHSTK